MCIVCSLCSYFSLLSDQQLTSEAGKVSLQVRGLDFVSKDVSLVEEQDNGGVLEPERMDGGVEERKTLVHSVLQRETDCETRLVLKGLLLALELHQFDLQR